MYNCNQTHALWKKVSSLHGELNCWLKKKTFNSSLQTVMFLPFICMSKNIPILNCRSFSYVTFANTFAEPFTLQFLNHIINLNYSIQ